MLAAVAATVKAWVHRSGSSAPAVHLTTRLRDASWCGLGGGWLTAGYPLVMATFYTILLIVAFLAIAGMTVLIVAKLFAGQQ